MSLWNGSPDGQPKDNDMYDDVEAAQLYREMTDGSTRPAFTQTTTKADSQFTEFFRNAFQIIDDMGPVCE